jgi:hypothetical protein
MSTFVELYADLVYEKHIYNRHVLVVQTTPFKIKFINFRKLDYFLIGM